MKFGYACVSAGEQNLALQVAALRTAGADRIFKDKGLSSSALVKPAYIEMLRKVRPGDEVMVWRMDRLSRSTSALLIDLQLLANLEVEFRSLTEQIDTAGPSGQLFFEFVGALAQLERDLKSERAKEQARVAHKVRKKPGRPLAISEDQWACAKSLLSEPGKLSIVKVAEMLGVRRRLVDERLRRERKAAEKAAKYERLVSLSHSAPPAR